MKSIQQAMLEEIYLQADAVARENVLKGRILGSDFAITLQQLEEILKVFES